MSGPQGGSGPGGDRRPDGGRGPQGAPTRRAAGTAWSLDPDRCFSPDPSQRALARALHAEVAGLPLLSPHGHVPPALLLDDAPLGDPATTFVVPDHYLLRMLHSQGVPLERLGVARLDGAPVETDPRAIWREFCANFHLFAGTPSGLWLKHELVDLFGLAERPSAANADRTYDHLAARLAEPGFRPRALFARFGIEVLATTDAATDSLQEHAELQREGMNVVPTFRPDAVIDPTREDFLPNLRLLEERSGVAVDDYAAYLAALEQRRAAFKAAGATATDHAALTADAAPLPDAEAVFDRVLAGAATDAERRAFAANMLMVMARMSAEDGLVMQLHVGSLRDHHRPTFERFGRDKGADMPIAGGWTRQLAPLLNELGAHERFRLVLYTLDETTYSRELAPLAGFYPALRLGAPWWFFDSVLGMERYLDAVAETAGIYNLAGFVDDTRAYPSIPARHDVWRRVTCDWLAGRVVRGLIDEDQAPDLAHALAYDLTKETYRLGAAG